MFPASYYAPAPNSTIPYRAQTPSTPPAVAATAVAPSFLVYHPQHGAPPPPPPIQFGMIKPQQVTYSTHSLSFVTNRGGGVLLNFFF